MKTCKQCKEEIKSKQAKVFCSRSCAVTFNNTKNPKRKLRKRCSECGLLITSDRTVCSPQCYSTRRERTSTKPDVLKEKCKARARDYRRKIKEKAVKFLGGKCSSCGYSKYIGSLDFHHEDPNNKDFSLSYALSRKYNWTIIKKELSKCVLLCANCHREVHKAI